MLDAGCRQRHDLHVDARPVHLGDALVAEIAKLRNELDCPGVVIFLRLLFEVTARAVEKSWRRKMFFKRDGFHDRTFVSPLAACSLCVA